jgi:cytochrome c oxidase assembly protein subunit 15
MITVWVVYFLILVGGIVRTTGAGMGCPDWPKCFDQWVPPTKESELPKNYQEIYKERGYANTTFNVVKTWTEYVNRLLGVITGITIVATVFFAVKTYWTTKRSVANWAILGLVFVLFQGWLGGMVVNSNLKPYLISLHLILALFVVGSLQVSRFLAGNDYVSFDSGNKLVRTLVFVLPFILLGQLLVGAGIRERIDHIALRLDDKKDWIGNVGTILSLHKLLALVSVLASVFLFIELRKASNKMLNLICSALVVLLLLQVLSGFSMTIFSFPALPQAVHVLFSCLLFGASLELVLMFTYNNPQLSTATNRS